MRIIIRKIVHFVLGNEVEDHHDVQLHGLATAARDATARISGEWWHDGDSG
ncbi:hypothetical protein [Bradyrhizobium sp. STM 3566]|uniref:hypothetical protein n=1 Tax=Bradyrhizobium sp. STM 3566 TaxID=578928 RepID=UPI00388FEAA7